MTESNQKPDYVFDGQYENFPRTLNLLKQRFHTKQIKNKKIDSDGKVPISGIFYFMLMSTCPEKDAMNWTMKQICEQNDLDRATTFKLAIQTFLTNSKLSFSTNKLKKRFHSFF
jgi:hypothetical protein